MPWRLTPQRLATHACPLAFLAIITLWFSPLPTDLDAMNFVLGVREYDVVHHQPHPPGAPVYISLGKLATSVLNAFRVSGPSQAPIEAVALALCSALSAVAVLLLWRRLIARVHPAAAGLALVVASVAPLLWVLAVIPLSDSVGLAAATGAQLLALRAESRGWYTAGFAAGLATGIRVQTALLTLPLLAWRASVGRERAWPALAGVAAGVATWLVPLLWVVRPRTYLGAFARQAGEDFHNPYMFAASPSIRGGIEALFNTVVLPWGSAPNAMAMVALIAAGALLLWRRERGAFKIAAVAIVPYLVFHLLLQETVTVRYALPLVVWGTYAAAACIALLRANTVRRLALIAVLITNTVTGVAALRAYSVEQGSMWRVVSALRDTPNARVIVHQGLSIPFDRVTSIVDERLKSRRLDAAREYEWRSAAEYWAAGGSGPVWFIADPRRTDLLLIDPQARWRDTTYFRQSPLDWLLSGTRPNAIRVAEFEKPQWIALRGFALSSEIGGISRRDGQGPSTTEGAVALVRPEAGEAWLTVGGRHVGGADDPPVRVEAWIAGRRVLSGEASAGAREFLLRGRIPTDGLARNTYVPLVVRSVPTSGDKPVHVAIEQFDFRSSDDISVSFGAGWHEPELDTSTGITWRWAAGRTELLVSGRSDGSNLVLRAAAPRPIRQQEGTIRIRSGSEVLDQFKAGRIINRVVPLARRARNARETVITMECSTEFVPAEQGTSPDQRRLCLQVFEFALKPAQRRSAARDGS